MYGSGVKTGMANILAAVTQILKGPLLVQHECLEVAVGIALLPIAPLERVVTQHPRIRSITAVYV